MRTLMLVMLAVVVTACAPAAPTELPSDSVVTQPAVTDPIVTETPESPSYSPNPMDINFQRGTVFISESQLILRESFPVQVALELSGELPSPCHQLRVNVQPPDEENKILVEAYTVINPKLNCIQVLKPFEQIVELGTFPGGHYTVWVNETLIGEFDT